MSKKIIILIILVVIVGIVAVVLWNLKNKPAQNNNPEQGTPTATITPSASGTPEAAVSPTSTVVPSESAQPSPTAEEKTVSIENFSFSPSVITVKAGTKITWTNKDPVGHTVTSENGSELDSKLLSKGETYSHVFSQKGTFSYYCKSHPYMKGQVVVE